MADRDIEDVRKIILDEALMLVPFEGWTPTMVNETARAAEIDEATLQVAFPDGALSILDFWSARLDDAMVSAAEDETFSELRIRDKVFALLRARLAALSEDKETFRRAAAFLALPQNAPHALRLIWRTADTAWRAIGDQSTDFNHYSKRSILSAVWTSTAAFWLSQDGDESFEKTESFLKDRIENVMQFEKLKANLPKPPVKPDDVFGFLGRLRYPAKF